MRREGLIDRAAARFRDAVTSGEWPVGERIPTETELVATYGIGRNTVREALQSLVHAGLLRREQGRGTFVISDSELDSSLERQLAGGTHRHYLELRLALDSAAARLAAQNRTDADVALLRDLCRRREESWAAGSADSGMRDDAAVGDARARADLALHSAVVEATHNPLYVKLYSSMLAVFAAHMRDEESEDEELAHERHAALVDAIAEGDADRASAVVALIFEPFMR